MIQSDDIAMKYEVILRKTSASRYDDTSGIHRADEYRNLAGAYFNLINSPSGDTKAKIKYHKRLKIVMENLNLASKQLNLPYNPVNLGDNESVGLDAVAFCIGVIYSQLSILK